MKKFLSFMMVAAIIMGMTSAAMAKDFKGVITYKISYPGMDMDASMAAMMPKFFWLSLWTRPVKPAPPLSLLSSRSWPQIQVKSNWFCATPLSMMAPIILSRFLKPQECRGSTGKPWRLCLKRRISGPATATGSRKNYGIFCPELG